jgi:hypothetical protein
VADAAAMPPNPSTAAIIAITRNTQAYQSICFVSSRLPKEHVPCQDVDVAPWNE